MGFRKRNQKQAQGCSQGCERALHLLFTHTLGKIEITGTGETTGALEEPGATSSTLGSTQKVVLSLRRGFLMNGG